jgi:hypothetical protein
MNPMLLRIVSVLSTLEGINYAVPWTAIEQLRGPGADRDYISRMLLFYDNNSGNAIFFRNDLTVRFILSCLFSLSLYLFNPEP